MSGVSRTTELGDEKRCLCCGDYWPADTEFFESRIATRDRLSTRCIACAREKRWSRPGGADGAARDAADRIVDFAGD